MLLKKITVIETSVTLVTFPLIWLSPHNIPTDTRHVILDLAFSHWLEAAESRLVSTRPPTPPSYWQTCQPPPSLWCFWWHQHSGVKLMKCARIKGGEQRDQHGRSVLLAFAHSVAYSLMPDMDQRALSLPCRDRIEHQVCFKLQSPAEASISEQWWNVFSTANSVKASNNAGCRVGRCTSLSHTATKCRGCRLTWRDRFYSLVTV